jgi:hypothetical protein
MKQTTADQLIGLLDALFQHSLDYAVKLKALERVAQDHHELFGEYEAYLSEIRNDLVSQKARDRTVEAIDRLRTELLRD